eukprot:TRINITY_DN8973_c0_g1_i1.p1 TRINITY_DN8973_c0_g1~~TRINITY_DN8973_c0_g1_i1.p1  ORF type:complete len:526 (+),score=128.29 TRINITY_DN8973_c0_g1_i1:168-1745(+)
MYLLEAKKKVEREEKARREREKREEKKNARREGDRKRAQAALDAKRKETEAREQSMMEEAMRRSKLTAQEDERARMASSAADLPRGGNRLPQARHAQRQPQVLRKPSPANSAGTSPQPVRKPQVLRQGGDGPARTSPQPTAAREVIASAPLREPRAAQPQQPVDKEEWRDVKIKCSYIGTFEVGEGKVDRAEVKKGIALMEGYSTQARPAQLILTLSGLKVMDTLTDKVAMAHALHRVSMSSIVAPKALFGFVAKNPGTAAKFCHVFKMSKAKYAENAQALVGKAFKIAFAKDRSLKGTSAPVQPSAPLATASELRRPDEPDQRRWAKQNVIPGRGAHREPSVMAAPSAAPTRMAVQKGSDLVMAPVEDDDDDDVAVANDDGTLGQDFLRNAPWYQEGLPREIAMELISSSSEGAFIVRDSQSQPGCYALTMKANGGDIRNFIIKGTSRGFIIGTEADGERPYNTLAELILAHAERRGVLPMELSLDTENKLYSEDAGPAAGDNQRESFVDPEYQSVLTWRQMAQ